MKQLKNPKSSFIEALIITLFIFGLGLLMGVFLENTRTQSISNAYLDSEINLIDIQLLSTLIDSENSNCEYAIQKNIDFGNKIYEDAKQLTKYEKSSQLKTDILKEHKRYDLLRTIFWINAIKIKERCGNEFHTLTYLYNFKEETDEEKQKQAVFSKFTQEIKEEYGNSIILIPIAIDLDVASIDLLVEKYNITKTTIIFNEKLKITEIEETNNFRKEIKKIVENIDENTLILN